MSDEVMDMEIDSSAEENALVKMPNDYKEPFEQEFDEDE